jgi:MFS family permease
MNSVNNSSNKDKWAILFIVVMITFMATLDSSIVNVALPVMAKDLNVTSAGIQLVVTSYLIIISATILVFGRLGDMTSKTRIFKFGIALFTLGSLLCGITSSLEVLVLARVIQAIGAAGAMANSQGIIAEVFPANERGRALGITGTFVALGSLVGPPLGGFIVDATSWKYIFLTISMRNSPFLYRVEMDSILFF